MDISKILSELRQERNRIDQAIAALERVGEAHSARRAAVRTGGRRRRRLTPEGRKRLSEMMKKRWAERRKRAKTA